MGAELYRIISTPKRAIRWYQKIRWRKGLCCPRCGVLRQSIRHQQFENGLRKYFCKACGHHYSDTTGTIFHNSKVPLWKWLLAIFEMSQPSSISAMELSKKLTLSYPTTLRMHQKIRLLLANKYEDDEDKKLGGTIEADEAWFGHKAEQDVVQGLVSRNGDLRLTPLAGLEEVDLQDGVSCYIKRGSLLFTDGRAGYGNVHLVHQTVNHSKGEYVSFTDRNVHTNTIEQIWGMMKGILRTVHHGVTKKWRYSYLYSFACKYNYRYLPNLFTFMVDLSTQPKLCPTIALQ